MRFHNSHFMNGGSKDDTLYKELELDRNASSSDIKKSWKKLALKHHPDKGGDSEKFTKLQTAYEILSDPEKKQKYDQFGMDGVSDTSMNQTNHSDIFDMFFGGRSHHQSQRRRKAKDKVFYLKVTLGDLYNGKKKKVAITRKKIVGEPKACDACNGTGRIKQRMVFGPGMIQEIHQGCQYCSGLGKSYKFENEKKEVTVEIEPGMSNDTKIRFKSYGDDIPNVENGDIVFCFDVQKHDNFARKGNNLFVKLTITLSEALTGCCFDITHLDNRLISIKSHANSIIGLPKNGGIPLRCISNEGMPIIGQNGKKGKLIVAFIIEFPVSINPKKQEDLKTILPKAIHKSKPNGNEPLYLEEVDSKLFNELNKTERRGNYDDSSDGIGCAQM